MEIKEAIAKIKQQKLEFLEECVDYLGVAEAYDMAISALEKQEAKKPTDAIEELIAALTASNEVIAKNKPKWIPVTERLPEAYTWVLVSAEKHEVAFDAFYDGAQWKDAILNGCIVTHWMPLPEPPKEVDDD